MSNLLQKNLAELADQIQDQMEDMKQGNFNVTTPVMLNSLGYYHHKIQVCQKLSEKQGEFSLQSKLIAELEQKNRELIAELNIWKKAAPGVTIVDGVPTTYFSIPSTPCTITIKQ